MRLLFFILIVHALTEPQVSLYTCRL